MHACTFQPSIPRRRANASTSTRTIRNFSSETLLDGGGGEGARRDGAWGHGVSAPRVGRVNGSASAPCRSVEEVGRRLFEESKILSERRFEGEERKRMAQEEAFARTCTFVVRAHWGVLHDKVSRLMRVGNPKSGLTYRCGVL